MKSHKWSLALALAMSLLAAFFWSLCRAEQAKKESKPQRVDLAEDLTAEAPGDWKAQQAKRQFRTHEFILPSSEKETPDGLLFVTHFGKGGGGGLEDNLKRWYGMMEQPDGTSSEKAAK